NKGFNAASAINSKILLEYLDNELANALVAPNEILAPKKSTSLLKSSFEMVVVPFPNIAASKLDTPDLSPSKTGGLSNVKLNDTRGSLWFSTTRTFNPFLRVNS